MYFAFLRDGRRRAGFLRSGRVVSSSLHRFSCWLVISVLLYWCLGAATGASSQRAVSAPVVVSAESSAVGAYYVAFTGSDSAPGTLSRPWRTIQHAADVLQPGEMVYVRAGTYAESVVLARSGAPGQPITFAAYAGETVVLDGGGMLSSAFLTESNAPDPHVSDVTIQGFTIRNYAGFGIIARSVNNRLTLQDLFIEGNGDAGIRLSNSDGTRIRDVLLRNNGGGFDCTPISPGMLVGSGCTHLYIGDVQAIDNGTQGGTSSGGTGIDAFAVEKGAYITVERSLARGGVGDGFDFKSDHTTLSQVRAYNTRNNFKLWGRDSTLVNALGYDATADANLVLAAGGSYTITNVTIANMQETAYLVVVGDTSGTGAMPMRITNSIFYNGNSANRGTLLYFGADVTQLTMANNLFYNPYGTDEVICAGFAPYNGTCFSAGDINQGLWPYPENRYADPAFVDAAAKDFHLGEESPAVNAGTPAFAPAVDLADSLRGARPDLGAYEAAVEPPLLLYLPCVRQS